MVLKEVAKDAYQRLLHGWAESDTPTTAATPTTGQRGRPRKVSVGSSQLATPSSSAPSHSNCPINVTSLYTAIKAATVSAISVLIVHIYMYATNKEFLICNLRTS